MSIDRIKQWVEQRLSEIYRSTECDNETYFCNSKEEWFKIDAIQDWNCLIIDYLPEDGDRFYPEDYDNLEKMLEEMLQEIEGPEITVESINKKLGFDFRTWKNPDSGSLRQDDGQNNPFNVLTHEELRFIINYFKK